jgi:hypothetical protein
MPDRCWLAMPVATSCEWQLLNGQALVAAGGLISQQQ